MVSSVNIPLKITIWYKIETGILGVLSVLLSYFMGEVWEGHYFFWLPIYMFGLILMIISFFSIAYTLKEWF